jgi:hypothetical protein
MMRGAKIIRGTMVSLTMFFIVLSIIIVIDWRNDALKARTEIPLMLEKDPMVKRAVILTNEGDFGNIKLAIDIFFKSDGILSVSKVDKDGHGPIQIYRIGNYKILIMDNYGSKKTLTLDLLRYLTGFSLETIYDLTRNYDSICTYIKGLPNISEYKEYSYESMNTIIDRMLARYRDECKIINFNDKEYFLAKYNYDDFVSFGRQKIF